MAFSKLKAHLRKAGERTIHGLWDAIGRMVDLLTAGKPLKVAITAIMRKLIVLANTLLKVDRKWINKTA
jgi:transposase